LDAYWLKMDEVVLPGRLLVDPMILVVLHLVVLFDHLFQVLYQAVLEAVVEMLFHFELVLLLHHHHLVALFLSVLHQQQVHHLIYRHYRLV